MILNHKAAIEFMVDLKEELVFNRQIILNFHAILSDNLLADPNASGRLRRIGVGIVWACERSSQRYVAVRQSLGEPNKFRLKFRNEIIEVVGEIVRGRVAPTVEEVTKAARERVSADHLDDFVRMIIKDLENLHEGNFARFSLRPSEYQAWREVYPRQETGSTSL